MADTEAVRKRTLVQQVEAALGAAIVSGRVDAGERVVVELLPEPLQSVSRSIWREAMRQLAVRGLVRPIKRRGTVARPRADWNLLDAEVLRWFSQTGRAAELVREMSEIRRMIEPFAARLAAERATQADIGAIRAAFAGLEDYVAGVESDPLVDIRFHTAILAASGNLMISGLQPVMAHILEASLGVTTMPVGEAPVREALELHRRLVQAIVDRDPDKAEAVMRRVIDFTYSTLEPASRV